jgi:hypothetical protein
VLFLCQCEQEFKFVDQEACLGKPAALLSAEHNVRRITKNNEHNKK